MNMTWGKHHNHDHMNEVISTSPAYAFYVALHAIDYAIDPEYAFSKQKTVQEFRRNIQNRFDTTHAELTAASKVRFTEELKLYKMQKSKNPNPKLIAEQEQVVAEAQAEYTPKFDAFLDARRAEEMTRSILPTALKIWNSGDLRGSDYVENVKQVYRDILLTCLWSADKPNYMDAEKFISFWLNHPNRFEQEPDEMIDTLKGQLVEWHTNQ